MERRSFLNLLLGASCVVWLSAIVFPVFAFLWPAKSKDQGEVLAGVQEDFPNNSAKIIKFGNYPAIVVRTPEGELRAFNATCTHLDCTVQFIEEDSLIWCACHNGKFDLAGKNISGPPPKPLIPLTIIEKDDEIFLSEA